MSLRTWPKRVLIALLVLTALAIWQQPRLTALYHVVTLFDETKIVQNFSSMDRFLHSASLPQAQSDFRWPEALTPGPERFNWRTQTLDVEQFLHDTETTSLLVVQQGKIVLEEYRMGTSAQDRRISWSMAKSFMSAVFGLALADGSITSLDDPIERYVPRLSDSAYSGVTIRDALNMASGVSFNEDYLDFNSDINKMGRVLALGGSMDDFAVGLKARSGKAGEQWDYVSIDTHVLAMVLRNATGYSLRDYLFEHLWQKLGSGSDGYYLTDGDGVAFALGGLNMQTRDYARFGQLFLNDGRWQEEQVLPAQWVRASTEHSAPVAPGADFGYGFQWWLPENSDGEFFAGGIYGQYIYVNRTTETVIVKTSAHRAFRDGQPWRGQTIALFRALAKHYKSGS